MIPTVRRSQVRLLVGTVLLVAGAGTYTLLSGGASPSNCSRFAYSAAAWPLRSQDVVTFSEDEEVRVTRDHLSADPSFNPDGSRVVFSTARDGGFYDHEYGGPERISLFSASSTGGDQARLTSGPYDTQPDWSPDGSKVVFVRGRHIANWKHYPSSWFELWTVDVETSKEQLLLRLSGKRLDQNPDWLWSPVWSPDGRRIALGRGNPERERQDLWVLDADGSNPRLILAGFPFGWYSSPTLAWSPDGGALAFSSPTEGVQILALHDRQPRHLSFGRFPAWSPDGTRIAYFDPSGRLTLIDLQGNRRERVNGAPLFYGAPASQGEGGLDWASC